jgi:hypothetical protein
MACHYPDPDSTALLHKELGAMNFQDAMGVDADTSEYGKAYLRKLAFDADPETLASMAKGILKGEFERGAVKIIWRKLPMINGFEEKREHTSALVLEYHPMTADELAAWELQKAEPAKE